jgi:hypothetical protein
MLLCALLILCAYVQDLEQMGLRSSSARQHIMDAIKARQEEIIQQRDASQEARKERLEKQMSKRKQGGCCSSPGR